MLTEFTMHTPKRSLHYFSLICAGLALLLCFGCAVTLPADFFVNAMAYEPMRSPVQIDASAAVDVVVTMTPEVLAAWKDFPGSFVANYRSGVEQMLRNDLTKSGLFARIVTNDATKADYLVKVAYVGELDRVRVTLTATETASGTQVSSRTREGSGGNFKWSDERFLERLGCRLHREGSGGNFKWSDFMAALKADLVADLQEKARQQQAQAARAEAEFFTKASLFDLLARSDKSVFLARERNLAIVAAKNQQLPAMLRDRKTDELSALVVKIEQTILELNHECEVAKDKAQQATATNGDPRQIEELRGLAISYRERIELLKPILTALKEEIANRGR